jgi:hypothetical protein
MKQGRLRREKNRKRKQKRKRRKGEKTGANRGEREGRGSKIDQKEIRHRDKGDETKTMIESRTEANDKRKKPKVGASTQGRRRKNSSATGLPSHCHSNTTKNGHQHHRQLIYPSSSSQVILFPSSSCMQNVHCACSASNKIITRLLHSNWLIN